MLDQMSTNTRIKELESEIDKLKLENSRVNSTLDELNAQLMIANGRVLMTSSMIKSESFAAELGNASKEEDNSDVIFLFLKLNTYHGNGIKMRLF